MRTRTIAAALLAGVTVGATVPAHAEAQGPAELLQSFLEGKPYDAVAAPLADLAGKSADGALALGIAKALYANQKLARVLYRHNARAGDRNIGLPVGVEMPSFENPSAEPIDVKQFRQVVADYVADLAAADEALAAVGERPAKVKVDLSRVVFDIDGNGKLDPWEHVGPAIFGRDSDDKPKDARTSSSFPVAFDTADASWMRGYANILSAAAKTLLSHDFEPSWDVLGPQLFARPIVTTYRDGVARSEVYKPLSGSGESRSEISGIANSIDLLHGWNWPVTDRTMWQEVRGHLLQAIRQNEITWRLASAETDDDNEWLPSPRQKSGVWPQIQVTSENVKAWTDTLRMAEDILEGRALVHHWRGINVNVRSIFDDPGNFDLVSWVTGHAFERYQTPAGLPVITQTQWDAATAPLGSDFITYMFYFN